MFILCLRQYFSFRYAVGKLSLEQIFRDLHNLSYFFIFYFKTVTVTSPTTATPWAFNPSFCGGLQINKINNISLVYNVVLIHAIPMIKYIILIRYY